MPESHIELWNLTERRAESKASGELQRLSRVRERRGEVVDGSRQPNDRVESTMAVVLSVFRAS